MTTTAHVDLSAFEHNVARIVSQVAPSEVWIAVKSNAYGHGMLELADNALAAGATGLAVLDVPAALRLRSHGVKAPLFAWLHGRDTDFARAISENIDLGVSTLAQLNAIANAGSGARIHLKIDTGLHRNGVPLDQWDSVCAAAKAFEDSGMLHVVGVWTHLADASTTADNAALDAFDDACARARAAGLKPRYIHAAASPTALRNERARNNLVRVGIAAYGISPFDDADGAELGYRPVLTLSSSIRSSADGRSIIDAGWFDGVPQVHDAEAWVSVAGRQSRVLAVSATHTLIDGTAPIGEAVELIGGNGPTAEQWARWTGTIGDEIVTMIPTRVRRVYVR